jgi:hypothetical protein
MTLTCPTVEGNVELFVANECDPSLVAEITKHLAHCPSCTASVDETRRLFGLLDGSFRWEEGAKRVRDLLREEPPKTLPFRRVPVFTRQRAALAALLLLTFGLGLLTRPMGSTSSSDSTHIPALALLSGGAQGVSEFTPGSNNREAVRAIPATLLVPAEKNLPPSADLRQPKNIKKVPLPPRVNLRLQFHNPGPNTWSINPKDKAFQFLLDVRGPGVITVPINNPAFRPLAHDFAIRIAPGKSLELPIDRLASQINGVIWYTYWTKPGDYSLAVRVQAQAVPANGTPHFPLTLTSPTIRVRIAARAEADQ